jgi:hypothetical protein
MGKPKYIAQLPVIGPACFIDPEIMEPEMHGDILKVKS